LFESDGHLKLNPLNLKSFSNFSAGLSTERKDWQQRLERGVRARKARTDDALQRRAACQADMATSVI
jgi:hypothetical protein